MSKTVEQALNIWQLTGADYHLVAARENEVYKITLRDQSFALRLRRKGYRDDKELWSELAWMDAVASQGIRVPAPVASPAGKFLHVVDDQNVDLLCWLDGETVTAVLEGGDEARREEVFRQIGVEMARLHAVSDAWRPPEGFRRCSWDLDGLLGHSPLWGKFWQNPALDPVEKDVLLSFRQAARAKLERLGPVLDYGLIHADLVSANIMIRERHLHLIDFDDGGFGYRLFDLATALVKHMDASDFPILQCALIDGYQSVRQIDLTHLDLFLTLRAATYVGWNVARLAEDGALARNHRFIQQAVPLAKSYLNKVNAQS